MGRILDSVHDASVEGTEKIPVSPTGHITPDDLKVYMVSLGLGFTKTLVVDWLPAGVYTIPVNTFDLAGTINVTATDNTDGTLTIATDAAMFTTNNVRCYFLHNSSSPNAAQVILSGRATGTQEVIVTAFDAGSAGFDAAMIADGRITVIIVQY
jgi:hypothetical protein